MRWGRPPGNCGAGGPGPGAHPHLAVGAHLQGRPHEIHTALPTPREEPEGRGHRPPGSAGVAATVHRTAALADSRLIGCLPPG